MALAIELFTEGSLNTFAKPTNVDTNARIVCYDIRDLGKQLLPVGMLVVNILRRRIKDEVFIDLIWKLLRAGYLEDWMKHQTYSGTPQGSGVSPLLANIYMNELDQFMERYQMRFNKGDKRRFSNAYVNANHHYARARERYAKKWATMSDEERRQARITQKELQWAPPGRQPKRRIVPLVRPGRSPAPTSRPVNGPCRPQVERDGRRRPWTGPWPRPLCRPFGLP